jgi:hypothetical protein
MTPTFYSKIIMKNFLIGNLRILYKAVLTIRKRSYSILIYQNLFIKKLIHSVIFLLQSQKKKILASKQMKLKTIYTFLWLRSDAKVRLKMRLSFPHHRTLSNRNLDITMICLGCQPLRLVATIMEVQRSLKHS